VRGKPFVLLIDNFFAYKTVKISDVPVFASQSRSGSYWAPLLEKAWAKVLGNYG